MTITELARLLATHTHTIAGHPQAGDCARDIKNLRDAILHRINRPIPPIDCGPCPTIKEDQKRCATGLSAKRDEIEITCWKCHITHNVEYLIQKRLNEVPDLIFNARDILKVMARIGEHVPESTWRRWRAKQQICASGELYGEPGYRLEDVRQCRRKYARHEAS